MELPEPEQKRPRMTSVQASEMVMKAKENRRLKKSVLNASFRERVKQKKVRKHEYFEPAFSQAEETTQRRVVIESLTFARVVPGYLQPS